MTLAVVALALAVGCKKVSFSIIKGVGIEVPPNLESVKVRMDFSSDVQSDIGGVFPIKDYGQIELEPSTPTNPFNIGFRLNTSVFNEQDFVDLQAVTTLPSGQPFPFIVDRALVQVKVKEQISSKFDIYMFVDVMKAEWLGVALTLKFLDNKNFPVGLAVAQQFVPGKDGYARVAGEIFGPKVDEAGNLAVPGGIAVFANVRGLINDARTASTTNMLIYDGAQRPFLFDGPSAPHYRKNPRDAFNVGQAFKTLMKLNDTRFVR